MYCKGLLLAAFVVGVALGGEVFLDEGRYRLSYGVVGTDALVLSVTAETTGYVGFGISVNGSMIGADLIIAGTYANQTGYIADYFGTANARPTYDTQQDAILLEGLENATHTILRFLRPINSTDLVQDLPIRNMNQTIIWSVGRTDDTTIHHMRRGSASLNLFLD